MSAISSAIAASTLPDRAEHQRPRRARRASSGSDSAVTAAPASRARSDLALGPVGDSIGTVRAGRARGRGGRGRSSRPRSSPGRGRNDARGRRGPQSRPASSSSKWRSSIRSANGPASTSATRSGAGGYLRGVRSRSRVRWSPPGPALGVGVGAAGGGGMREAGRAAARRGLRIGAREPAPGSTAAGPACSSEPSELDAFLQLVEARSRSRRVRSSAARSRRERRSRARSPARVMSGSSVVGESSVATVRRSSSLSLSRSCRPWSCVVDVVASDSGGAVEPVVAAPSRRMRTGRSIAVELLLADRVA